MTGEDDALCEVHGVFECLVCGQEAEAWNGKVGLWLRSAEVAVLEHYGHAVVGFGELVDDAFLYDREAKSTGSLADDEEENGTARLVIGVVILEAFSKSRYSKYSALCLPNIDC